MHVPITKNIIISWFIGCVFGLSVSLFTVDVMSNYTFSQQNYKIERETPYPSQSHAHSYNDFENTENPDEIVVFHNNNESAHKDDDLVARKMAENVKVLCWVSTHPENHKSKARHVMATWGRRCNKILLMSSISDEEVPTVKLELGDGGDNYTHLWGKTKSAFRYVYENHFEEYDWFVKADDDTYMIIENLRFLLKDHNSSSPLYFGRKFKPFVKQGYMSGGAGYVLSKEALRRFVEVGIGDANVCRLEDDGNEDVEVGHCMNNLGIEAVDTRDDEGRKRFMPFVPEHHLIPGFLDLSIYEFYDEEEGLAACSDHAIRK